MILHLSTHKVINFFLPIPVAQDLDEGSGGETGSTTPIADCSHRCEWITVDSNNATELTDSLNEAYEDQWDTTTKNKFYAYLKRISNIAWNSTATCQERLLAISKIFDGFTTKTSASMTTVQNTEIVDYGTVKSFCRCDSLCEF